VVAAVASGAASRRRAWGKKAVVKHLYFLRHAKSDWGTGFSSDHERPLARRGIEAAALVGRFLTVLDQAPEAVVSSSAVRARTTAELAREAGGWSAGVESTPDLYESTPADLLAIIRRQDDVVSRLLLVGHQPTWSETIGLFVGEAEVKLVTAALARVDLGVESWADASFGRGVLCWLVTPKLLGSCAEI
jgi:phosphohistidine phosphatase